MPFVKAKAACAGAGSDACSTTQPVVTERIRDQKAFKRTIVSVSMLLVLYLVTSFCPTIFWLNLTDSEPIGLYQLEPVNRKIRRGELVVMAVPEEFRQYVYGRGWLPEGWALFKHVGAVAGDVYCVTGSWLTVNGKPVGPVYAADEEGRPLPQLAGCQQVPVGHFIPIATRIKRSFDGRYMGAVKLSAIQGIAKPVITF